MVGGVVPSPPQDTPFRVKSSGAESADCHVPCSPKSTVPPSVSAPFQSALTAVTAWPVCVTVAFHAEVTCRSPSYVQVSRHPVSAEPVWVMRTWAE